MPIAQLQPTLLGNDPLLKKLFPTLIVVKIGAYLASMKRVLLVLFTITHLTVLAGEVDTTLCLFSDEMEPVGNKMFVRYSNKHYGDLIIRIHNDQGITIKEFIDSGVEPGFHQTLLPLTDMESGKYTISIVLNNERCSAVFIKPEDE
jgi:hypothetical protein